MGLFDSFKKTSRKVSASRGSKRVVGLVVEAYKKGIVFKDLRYRYYVLRDNDSDDVVYSSFDDDSYFGIIEDVQTGDLKSPRECIDNFWKCFEAGLYDELGVNDPDDPIDLRVYVYDVNGEFVGEYKY